MITIDLTDEKQQKITVSDLLKWASSETVRILVGNGRTFILEEDDEFEREVETLGKSEKFAKFLQERSQEQNIMSLDEFKQRMGE